VSGGEEYRNGQLHIKRVSSLQGLGEYVSAPYRMRDEGHLPAQQMLRVVAAPQLSRRLSLYPVPFLVSLDILLLVFFQLYCGEREGVGGWHMRKCLISAELSPVATYSGHPSYCPLNWLFLLPFNHHATERILHSHDRRHSGRCDCWVFISRQRYRGNYFLRARLRRRSR
jgi:hypothetical protein